MMTGLDVLLIIIAAAVFWQIMLEMDAHERWINRQELRDETWRKIREL